MISRKRKLVFTAVTLLALFAAGEAAVRVAGEWDADGNFRVGKRWLRPRRIPVRTVEASLARAAATPTSFFIYDPLLGWSLRPNGRSEDGLFAASSRGVRSAPTECPAEPAPGRLRIVLLGDSFTYGNDVGFEDTWGRALEVRLREAGLDAEVLNLGVAGYGFDQIYLRWKELGASLSPAIVVLGYCAGDADRVVRVHWCFHDGGRSFPFSKPRFVRGDGALRLVNSPTVPPEKIPGILGRFEESQLAAWEGRYVRADYEEHLWLASKLLALVEDVAARNRVARWREKRRISSLESEEGALSFEILDALRRDVAAHGAQLLAVHLPWPDDIQTLSRGWALAQSDFMSRLERSFPIVRPDDALLAAARTSGSEAVFIGGEGHYTAKANRIVAEAVAREILKTRGN